MRTNNLLGIVFANVHDDLLPQLTAKRSMASLPFAGRYRLIDFSLSNLVNAGVSQVGVITKYNYQSLMDHLGNGKSWDLDRKNGGLVILPPFSTADSTGVYHGHMDALAGIVTFLERANQEYVCLCDSDVISNVDIAAMLDDHVLSGADFTIAYKHGRLPKNHEDIMVFEHEGKRITGISFPKENDSADYSLDILIVRRKLLIELVEECKQKGQNSITRQLLAGNVRRFCINGYCITDFAEVVDGVSGFFRINMKMLESRNRRQLFNAERPVYTKTHDCMPTRYGLSCRVENSLIGDGCLIEGTVKNSVVFRNVTIGPGAVVENAIVMQGTRIEADAVLRYAVLDKETVIGASALVSGTKTKVRLVAKGERIETT